MKVKLRMVTGMVGDDLWNTMEASVLAIGKIVFYKDKTPPNFFPRGGLKKITFYKDKTLPNIWRRFLATLLVI